MPCGVYVGPPQVGEATILPERYVVAPTLQVMLSDDVAAKLAGAVMQLPSVYSVTCVPQLPVGEPQLHEQLRVSSKPVYQGPLTAL